MYLLLLKRSFTYIVGTDSVISEHLNSASVSEDLLIIMDYDFVLMLVARCMNIHISLSVFIYNLSFLLVANMSRVPILFFHSFLFFLTN